jgi:glycosyltransferase involved in cell wall biosynthesis
MKICFVANASSVLIKEWASFFVERGHDVSILSKKDGNIPKAKIYFPTFLKSFRKFPPIIRRTIENFVFYFFIFKKLREIKPEVVNSIYLFPYSLYSVYSFYKAPQITSVFGSDILVLAKKYSIFRFLSRKIFERSSLVQADSEEIKKWAIKFGCPKKKMFPIILPGVKTHLFKKRGEKKLNKTIISTRSFSPVYDIETTLKAFSIVLTKHPDAKLIIAGSGILENKLEALANELGINKNIKWLGVVEHSSLVNELNRASVYISSSLSDSTSASLLEAMAASLPVIVSDAPANFQWIKDGYNGRIFKRQDYESAANCIIKMFENYELAKKFGERSRNIVKEKADYEKVMLEFENECMKLLPR